MSGIKGLLRGYQDGGSPPICHDDYGNEIDCPPEPCPPGQTRNPATGLCEGTTCPEGQERNDSGQCVPIGSGNTCPPGQRRDYWSGQCVSVCGPGYEFRNGECVPAGSGDCPPGHILDPNGDCVEWSGSNGDRPCAPGFTRNDDGHCMADSSDTGNNGGNGSGTMPVSWRTSASNIPGLSPYYADLASSLYRTGMEGYTPYGGQEIAGFSPFETQAMRGIGAYARGPGPSGMTAAGQAFGAAGYGMGEMAGGAGDVGTFAGMAPGAFADTYMSPYQRAVTDIQTRQAREQGQKALAEVGSQAAQARAFGGGRHGVQESEVMGQTAQQVADIEA